LNYLFPELEIVRVGLAESWRRGLRVVHAPVAVSLNPAASNHLRLLCAGKWP